MGPVTLIFPLPDTSVSPWLEGAVGFIVLNNVISPAPASVEKVTLCVRVIPVANDRFVFVVLIFAPMLFNPAPFWVNPPIAAIAPVAFVVNKPPFVTVTVPLTVRLLFTVRAAPVKLKFPGL
jgi:hypothetical protein